MRIRTTSVLIFLAVLLLFRSVALAQIALPSQTDTQEWNDVQISVPVTKNIDFNIVATLRIGRDLSRPVDERFGSGATFRFGKYLSFAPFYSYIATQPFRGRRTWENRLTFPATLRFEAGLFRLSDRNQFERRFRHPGGAVSTRYRNKFQVDHPIGPDKIKLSLFVSDEVFYDWAVNDWVRNRASIGISKPLTKQISLDLYYLRQNDGRSVPGDLHVIGTVWRIRL
jgi:hypothetical protein